MIIKIDDNINPEERKRLLITIPVMYAIWKCDENLTAASNFLGISLRCLRNRMSLYPELRAFKGEMVDEVHQKYFNITYCKNDPFIKYKKTHIDKLYHKFWFLRLSDEEKQVIIDRIKKIY